MAKRIVHRDRPGPLTRLYWPLLLGSIAGSLLAASLRTEEGGLYTRHFEQLMQGGEWVALRACVRFELMLAALVFCGALAAPGALLIRGSAFLQGAALSLTVTTYIRAFGPRGYAPALLQTLIPGLIELFVLLLLGCRALEHSRDSRQRDLAASLRHLRGDRSFLLCLPLSCVLLFIACVIRCRILQPLACALVRRYF